MLVIVGSGDLDVTPEITSIIIGKIVATDAITPIAVRAARSSGEPTTKIEQFVADLAVQLGRIVYRHFPDGYARGDIWKRDYAMVERASAVLAFFPEDREMEGGTGHVVTAALNRNVPVEAYRLDENGHPELLGSDDGAQGGYVVPNGWTFQPAPSGWFTPTTPNGWWTAPSTTVKITSSNATTSGSSLTGLYTGAATLSGPLVKRFANAIRGARYQAGSTSPGGNGSGVAGGGSDPSP